MKSKAPNKKAKLDNAAGGSSKSDKIVIKSEPLSPKPSTPSQSELLAVAKMKAAVVAAASTSTNLSLAHQASTLGLAASIQDQPSYPHFAVLDLSKDFPKMTNLLGLTKGASPDVGNLIPLEDIDSIQGELETLWSSISVRMRTLEKERELLQHVTSSSSNSHSHSSSASLSLLEHYDLNHQEKINAVKSIIDSGHGTRTSVSAAAALVLGVTTPNATSAVAAVAAAAVSSAPVLAGSNRKSNNSIAAAIKLEKQPKKKLKGELASIKRGSESGVGSIPANRFTQNRSHSLSLDDCHAEAPNQFWQFSDAYCHDITTENLETLEKLVEESRQELPAHAFEIPPLGKHFLEQEEFAGCRKHKTRLEKKERDNDYCGPLTQRLVAALVEDRVSLYNNTSQQNDSSNSVVNGTSITNGTNGGCDFQGTFMSRPGLVKVLGLDTIGATNGGNGVGGSLESRLKQVLLEQGLLLGDESAEDPDLPDDDDILGEIKRTQAALKKLRAHNTKKLEDLYKMGKEANARIALKEDLSKADKDVLESYKLVHTARVKKKPITKKEKEAAVKALQNRMVALEKLGDVQLSVVKK